MSKEGFTSSLSKPKVTSLTLRGFRFRDLKSTTNREIAAKQKKIYLKIEWMLKEAKKHGFN